MPVSINYKTITIKKNLTNIVFVYSFGIRLEVNYVPNKGIFEKNAKFNPSGDY